MRWAHGRYAIRALALRIEQAQVERVARQLSQMVLMEQVMTAINEMSKEQLVALVAQMQASSQRKLTLKVSEKGAVSLYGLGRFPVTLYGSQWERLLNEVEQIKGFLTVNASLLSVKS